MMRLLFTCMGTSDPVRGYHDGPMLHIIRHYRPEVICVFLSGEAAALDGTLQFLSLLVINHLPI